MYIKNKNELLKKGFKSLDLCQTNSKMIVPNELSLLKPPKMTTDRTIYKKSKNKHF